MMKYHLSFDTISDSADGKPPDVEIIDYQYRASGHFASAANREMVNLRETFRQDKNLRRASLQPTSPCPTNITATHDDLHAN